MTIGILDYGLGNCGAIHNIYKQAGIRSIRVTDASHLEEVSRLVLPGVGAFDYALDKFRGSTYFDLVESLVLGKKTPVLGICVGMQMMCTRSDEGNVDGLGWIDAEVKEFASAVGRPCPHMGWNDITPVGADPLFNNLETGARFYFLHSFYVVSEDRKAVVATADYGLQFCCAFKKDNIYGVQFHPEKGHAWGVTLLLNFARTGNAET